MLLIADLWGLLTLERWKWEANKKGTKNPNIQGKKLLDSQCSGEFDLVEILRSYNIPKHFAKPCNIPEDLFGVQEML